MTPANQDTIYLNILLQPMLECAKYKPAFGKQSGEGVTLTEFRVIYGEDPLYHWVGLDSDLMYAAHKAAGGMTSIYRQLGIGCERLLREIIKDRFRLTDEQVSWWYEYEKEQGVTARHTLDARIDIEQILVETDKNRVKGWLERCGQAMNLPARRIDDLRGVILEVRQGYKSADAKRQNADLRYGTRAYNENYLPTIVIVSTQASEPVCRRYRAAQIPVLVGSFGNDLESTFSFFENVVGYNLAAFFEQNSPTIRNEIGQILSALLSPSSNSGRSRQTPPAPTGAS